MVYPSSPVQLPGTTADRLAIIQGLYDRHRFLEAYRITAEYWKPGTDLTCFSVSELVLGGRLAARLGGARLSRWLFRAAYARDPSNPYVRYFIGALQLRGLKLVEFLQACEDEPDPDCDDPDLRASWLAWRAVTWAFFRDFARAHDCLDRARSVPMRDGWVHSCESQVRGLEDRWQESLDAAERAWEISPGAPYAAAALGNSLVNLGRVGESAGRLAAAAETTESCEVAASACWHQCALAETLTGEERRRALDRAASLAERLPALAPLADRETKPGFARVHLDIASLLDDHKQVEKWAQEAGSPFHKRVLENLQQNPDGRRILLPFRRIIQKHDTCLPASISSVLAATGIQLDADAMAREITYGGTASWAAAEWLEQRGFVARFFAATRETATTLLRNEIPFVLTLEADESAHAVAVVGLDESRGTLAVHDPRVFRSVEYLIDALGRINSPLGPKGIAVVSPDRADVLDKLLQAEQTEVMSESHRYQRALAVQGPAAARQVVAALASRHPQHPGTRWLQALEALDGGRNGEALKGLRRLLNEFPGCPYVRRALISACRALGNTGQLREVLAGIVDAGRLPGIQSDQDWRHPPSGYVSEYADLLRRSAVSRKEARRLLNSVIAREPTSAGAWHVLGDLFWHDRNTAGRLLALRIASCLANNEEHHAQAYADALYRAGNEDEGLAWLRARVDTLAPASKAAGPWVSWIGALEDYGYPERALVACDEALQQRGSSPELLRFAVPFLARMGRWEDSEACLRRLEAGEHRPSFLEAAVGFHKMKGEVDVAIPLVRQWVDELPRFIPARRQLLDLTARKHGLQAAVNLAGGWRKENPGHEEFEGLYAEGLDNIGSQWKKDLLLLHRVKRNPEDARAWCELTSRRLSDYAAADESRRLKLETRIAGLLRQCDRTAPDSSNVMAAHAEWHAVRGDRRHAVDCWLKAMDAATGGFDDYRKVLDCSASLDDAERRQVYRQVEAAFLSSPGPLRHARDIIFLVAERFGAQAAEEAAERWKASRPDEPEAIESAADLLLSYGHGRSDVDRAMSMLEPAVRRFPYHVGLRLSLAGACRRLGKDTEAETVLGEIIRRHPGNAEAHLQLAWVYARRGNGDQALRLLESLTAHDSQNLEAWDTGVQILIRSGRLAEARSSIRKGLQRSGENDVIWRERAIRRLMDCEDDVTAVKEARESVRLFPHRAYLWYLLGAALMGSGRLSTPGEIESCFHRSLSRNASLYVAADSLAVLLVEQRRYEEAEQICARIAPRLSDPSPARGRLAWIHRQKGDRQSALAEMTAVLHDAPWYGWGWVAAMDWLREDKAYDKARQLLCPIPPELRNDVPFRTKRLTVLAEANVPKGELDVEWDALLRDFPEEVPLHLERYDALRDANRLEESAAVLKSIRLVAPDSPFVLARLIEVLAREGNTDEAIQTLLRVWFAQVEESEWPASHAWQSAKKSGFPDAACEAARRRLDEGERPTPRAFAIMAEQAMRSERSHRSRLQPFWRTWFPGRGARTLQGMLDVVDRACWFDGSYRGKVFRQWSIFGYQRLVVRYWKRKPGNFETDVGAWAELGRALVDLSRRKQARKVLAEWRPRSGVKMWMVASYVNAIPRHDSKNRREVLSTCRDALAGLRHDHCAKFLAHAGAEAAVLAGDFDGFRLLWDKHRTYFNGKLEEPDWFPTERTYLLAGIPTVGRLLDHNDPKLFRQACKKLRSGGAGTGSGVQSVPRIPQWAWFLIVLGMLQLLRMLQDAIQK